MFWERYIGSEYENNSGRIGVFLKDFFKKA